MARRDYVYSNKSAGTLMLIGAVCVAVGALLPWIALQTLKVGLDWRILRIDVAPKHSVGGLHDGGLVLLIVGGVVAMLAILTLWSSRGRAVIRRFIAFLLGLGFAALAAYIIANPVRNYADVLVTGNIFDATTTVTVTTDGATEASSGDADPAVAVAKGLSTLSALQAISIDVEPGAYLLLAGGILVAFGAVFPGRRSPKPRDSYENPVPPAYGWSEGARPGFE